jgi:hypothetical protein
MNWDAIGAIGELVSALAVLLTLIYLARQIRHGANTNEAEIFSNSLDAYHNWRRLVIDHADLLTRFERGETLTDSEMLVATNISMDFAFASSAGFKTASIYDLDRAIDFVSLMVLQLETNRLLRETWPTAKRALATCGFGDFVAAVEAALEAKTS